MTTWVLVHGGFTDGAYWSETAALLKKAGDRVLVPELVSTGPDPAGLCGLAEDTAVVRQALDAAGEPAVLVGHSYSGMVVTEAADHPGIAHSVYVGALWPQRGMSMGDLFAAGPPLDWVEPTADGAAFRVTSDVDLAHRTLCADLDPARVPQWHADLVYSAAAVMGTPSSAPDRSHPVTYVVLDQDQAIPTAAQEMMAQGADRVEHLSTGHVPQLSAPDALAAVLQRVPVR